MRRSSSASRSIWRWFSSRALVTESHSPIAIEQAPATSPARPVNRIVRPGTAAPATPMTRLKFDTSPSLAPSTAARSALPPARWPPSSRATALPGTPLGGAAAIASTMRLCERLATGRPPATASGCASYWPLSRRSSALRVGSTNCGPKRRASQASERVRQPGCRAGTLAPMRASWLRQNSACASSTAASRRYTSARRGSSSASAIARYSAALSTSPCRLLRYRAAEPSSVMASSDRKTPIKGYSTPAGARRTPGFILHADGLTSQPLLPRPERKAECRGIGVLPIRFPKLPSRGRPGFIRQAGERLKNAFRPLPGSQNRSQNELLVRTPEQKPIRVHGTLGGTRVSLLLRLSRAIDALNERVGHLVYWLILAAVLVSAGN